MSWPIYYISTIRCITAADHFPKCTFFCIFLNWLEYSKESESGHKEGDEMQPTTSSSVVTS